MAGRVRFGKLGRGVRRLRLGFSRALLRWRLGIARSELGRAPFMAKRFQFVPPPLELADPTVAGDIAAGHMVLAGRTLLTGKRTAFELPAPSPAFGAALESFEWLAHFAANDRPSLREHARRMLREWLARREAGHGPGIESPSVVARRVIAWLSHSGLIAEEADHAGYRALMVQLARDAAVLRRFARRADIGVAALSSAIALAYHALCLDSGSRAIARAEQLLASAIARQVFADGGTSDRNAASALQVAADLIPLDAVYRARQRATPEFLTEALLRLVGFVRMMQHDDGGFAHFAGAGLARRDIAAEVAQFGGARVPRRQSAPQSGFERLESANGLLIADTGMGSGMAAGALSFEFASRASRLIVNCGLPPHLSPESEASRVLNSATAHSTLLIDDQALERIEVRETLAAGYETIVVAEATGAPPLRRKEEKGETLVLGHAGLRRRTGYIVQRELTMLASGGLAGIDRLIEAETRPGAHRATLVFHVHPLIAVEHTMRQDTLLLRRLTGVEPAEAWIFEAVGHAPQIEESRCYERDLTNHAGRQIVLDLPLIGNVDVLWRLVPFLGASAAL